jgi:hypothetical protein
MVKTILTAAIAVVFVVTGLYAVFSAGSLLNTGIERVLGVEDCIHAPKFPSDDFPGVECELDKNQQKRELARGIATLLVTLPVAWVSYRQLKKTIKA